jgi:hypothetical protein
VADNTSRTSRENAGSARFSASGGSIYSRGDPIRRGIPGYYSSSDPVARRIRLPLVPTIPHQSLNTKPCIIGVLLIINLLPPTITITSCVVHFVNDIGKLTGTFVLRIRGIVQAIYTPFGLRSTRRCINHLN